MNRYHNGQIYKLVNTVDDRIYMGSTAMPLSKRLSNHKKAARKHTERRVYKELNTVGWSNVRIVLIEAYRCENKNELIAREQHHMDLLKPELNKAAASGQRCIHDRQRGTCVDCGGVSVCEHNKQRSECKDCGGSQICEHSRQRSQCKDCGGGSICEHDKRRIHCKECSPKVCELCDITTSKGDFNRHLKTEKHLRNSI